MPRRSRDEFIDGGDDEDENIEYGVRRSIRRTSVQYRGSSSIFPAERMEQELYYTLAVRILERCIYLANIICLLFTIHNHYNTMVAYCRSLGRCAADAIAARADYIKHITNRVMLLMGWIMAYGELCLLRAEDLSIYIRRRNRFGPKRFRRLDDISIDDCYAWFGLHRSDLRRMYQHWRVPDRFRTPSRHTFTGEECFIILLYHMEVGEAFTRMARNVFGGDPRDFSKMCDVMIEYLYHLFYNKISGTSLSQWIPEHLDRCRMLIHNALTDGAGVLETEYVNGQVVNATWIRHHFDFNTFRIFGFLDDFALPTSRPGTEARRRYRLSDDIQRAYYSGYLRRHGLKAQVVYLPIGIIGSVFITELRQNDNGVQNISGLNDYLVALFVGILIGGLYPCLYCDGIFNVLATILPRFVSPTPELLLLNMRLASLRECIEHVFGHHKNRFRYWQTLPYYLHLYSQGKKVRRMSLVSFFILNCYYCINGTGLI